MNLVITRIATFVIHGRPRTYKPPRHRFGQKHFYCGHSKEMKAARKVLEESWASRKTLQDCAVKLVVRACGFESYFSTKMKTPRINNIST